MKSGTKKIFQGKLSVRGVQKSSKMTGYDFYFLTGLTSRYIVIA
jgi:hypothetical protein